MSTVTGAAACAAGDPEGAAILAAADLSVLSDTVFAMNDGVTPEPFGDPAGPGLWHHKGKELPAYIQQVAHGLVKSGMGESRAIATAVSRCKVWCAGGDQVKADTRAKACAAVAEWEVLKGEAHAAGPKGYVHGWIFVGPGEDVSSGRKVQVHLGTANAYQDGAKLGHTYEGGDGKHYAHVHHVSGYGPDDVTTHDTREAALNHIFEHGSTGDQVRDFRKRNYGAAWDEGAHPRVPQGVGGGEFAPAQKGGGKQQPAKAPGHAAPKKTPAKPGAKQPAGTRTERLLAHFAHVAHLAHLAHTGKGKGPSPAEVRQAQRLLNEALGLKLVVDGKFGPKTLAAVKLFQSRHGTAAVMTGKPSKPHAAGPRLITIPGVDLVAAGTWDLSSGRQTFTPEDLASAVEASSCPAVGNPVIKLGHVDARFDGEPALGQVTNMRLDPAGVKLLGDLSGMPGWLAAPNDDGKSVMSSGYPRRSVEGSYGFRCQIGHVHPFVLTGLALLGVTAPGVGVLSGLPDIAALYGVKASAAASSPWAVTYEEGEPVVAISEEDVRRAYYATGPEQDWWITELQMYPSQLIVANGSGQVYRVPFQVEDEDHISFAAPEEMADYASVAASRGTGPSVLYASAEDSRAGLEVDAAADGGWVQRGGKWVYDPDGDGDDDSTAAGDTDHSHWDASGKQLKPIPPNPQGHGGKPMAAAAVDDSAWDASRAWAAGAASDDPAKFYAAICLGRKSGGDPATQEHWALPYRYSPSSPPNAAALRSILSVLGGGMGGAKGLANASAAKAKAVSLMKAVNPDYQAAADGTPPQLSGDNVVRAADNAMMGHPACTGTHSHAHPAYGAQGSDATHSHSHSHSGDNSHGHAHAPAAGAGNDRKGGSDVEFTTEQEDSLRGALGLVQGEELDPEAIVTAAQVLRSQATQKVAASRPLPPNVMTVDREAWAALNARVEAGERFQAKKAVEERDDVIAKAVREGKFSASRVPLWQRQWDAAPEATREVIASLQKNVVPVEDVGTRGTGDGFDDEAFEAEFAAMYPPGTRGFGKQR